MADGQSPCIENKETLPLWSVLKILDHSGFSGGASLSGIGGHAHHKGEAGFVQGKEAGLPR